MNGFRDDESGLVIARRNDEAISDARLRGDCFVPRNDDRPPVASCLLLSASFLLLPSFCFLPSAFCLLLSAFCFLLPAFVLRNGVYVRLYGRLAVVCYLFQKNNTSKKK
jgi:hypothetical protein